MTTSHTPMRHTPVVVPYRTRTGLEIGRLYTPPRRWGISADEERLQTALLRTPRTPTRLRRAWVAVLALCSSCAQAEFMSGNDVYSRMTSSDPTQRLEAMMYIAGVADVLQGVISCPPPTSTLGQVYDMVKQYYERNPEQRSRSGDHAVTTVLRAAWPCKPTGTKL